MDDDDITKKFPILQRERRQMQAKHLWYNVDIRWVDLKDKLEVLAPTGLTRDDIWRHLFLTKQRKNPYEEGCYTGEDLEDVKRKWEAKKEPLFLPIFWFYPIYREMLNSASRHRPSKSMELRRAASGLVKVICRTEESRPGGEREKA